MGNGAVAAAAAAAAGGGIRCHHIHKKICTCAAEIKISFYYKFLGTWAAARTGNSSIRVGIRGKKEERKGVGYGRGGMKRGRALAEVRGVTGRLGGTQDYRKNSRMIGAADQRKLKVANGLRGRRAEPPCFRPRADPPKVSAEPNGLVRHVFERKDVTRAAPL